MTRLSRAPSTRAVVRSFRTKKNALRTSCRVRLRHRATQGKTAAVKDVRARAVIPRDGAGAKIPRQGPHPALSSSFGSSSSSSRWAIRRSKRRGGCFSTLEVMPWAERSMQRVVSLPRRRQRQRQRRSRKKKKTFERQNAQRIYMYIHTHERTSHTRGAHRRSASRTGALETTGGVLSSCYLSVGGW